MTGRAARFKSGFIAAQRVRELIRLQHELTRRPVVVVPVLVSTGRVSQEKLPRDLEGLPITYTDQGLLPHAEMARWVESRVRSVLRTTTAVDVK